MIDSILGIWDISENKVPVLMKLTLYFGDINNKYNEQIKYIVCYESGEKK